jgi:hypothetical protein
MNIGPSHFPPALDHVGHLRKGRGDSSNSLQLTLLGGGGVEALFVLSSSRVSATTTEPSSAAFFSQRSRVQVSSQPMKCRRQSLSHEFTEI